MSSALLLIVLLAVGPLFEPLPKVCTSISIYNLCVCCRSLLLLTRFQSLVGIVICEYLPEPNRF